MSKNPESDNSRVYEIAYVIASSVPEEKVSKEYDSIKSILTKVDAEIISEGAPSFRDLAYEMVKKIGGKNERYTQGYFGWFKFALDKDKIESVKKDVESIDSIIRIILTTTVREETFLGKLGAGVENSSKAQVVGEVAGEVVDSATALDGEVKIDEVETTNEA